MQATNQSPCREGEDVRRICGDNYDLDGRETPITEIIWSAMGRYISEQKGLFM
jgi:hypothetical protein